MALTDYQAKYLAYELTKRCPSDSVEKFASTVLGAQVDINPYQVDTIDKQREELIAKIEGKRQMGMAMNPIFSVRWSLR